MAAPPGGLTAEHLALQTYPRAMRARLFPCRIDARPMPCDGAPLVSPQGTADDAIFIRSFRLLRPAQGDPQNSSSIFQNFC